MPKWSWARSKEFITKLQEAPKPPVVVPIVPYPEEEGIHEGNRYYATGVSQGLIQTLLSDYLFFLEESKQAILMGRQNSQVQNLAISITEGKENTYEKAKAIHSWVYSNIFYNRTPHIIPPWDLIKPGTKGDCKSFAVLVASLLGLADIPCWLKLVKISSVPDLHIYGQANLTWAVVDAVGSLFNREVKPVSGYVLYEIDRTAIWPPRVLPSGAEVWIPEGLRILWPIIGVGGAIALGWVILKDFRRRKK